MITNEASLLATCREIEGMSFAQLAMDLSLDIPSLATARKGWLGGAIEKKLGADAGVQSAPDFTSLGVELKTLPINANGKPAESTFITHISLRNLYKETWQTSHCLMKLKRVLWVPVEGDKQIPFLTRRIGRAFLWSPSQAQARVLEEDWHLLTAPIVLGQYEKIDAKLGTYLQVRPKGANGRALSKGIGSDGCLVQTLPRGFYLRASFTGVIYQSSFVSQ